MKRYVVGIDLGTTNTVVAYADSANWLNLTGPDGQPGNDEIHLLQIEQLVAAGQISASPLLPSVRYHGAPGELAPLELTLPWPQSEATDSAGSAGSAAVAAVADGANRAEAATHGPVVFGQFARTLGAQVPGRLVVSAKSWLSHAGVDRLAPILPWGAPDGAPEGVAKVSPVAASASYLAYVRCCWNHQFPDHPLEQQDVVLTVPASFDEGARLLTIEAAHDAGLPQLRLLEEPQAVLHDWLFRHRANLARDLAGTQLVLVCDVGGGTTDLSLIRVQMQGGEQVGERSGQSAGEPAGQPILTRIGVGDHLMLGGDNMDLALAHLVETRLAEAALASGQVQAGAGPRLSASAWSQLMERCRAVKESLLSADAPEHAAVTLLGAGSRLIARAKSVDVLQAEVQALIVDGFFPVVGKHDVVKRGRSGIVEFGLPYARDPAITRHIASFLQQQGALSAALPAGDNAAQEGLPSGLPDIPVSDTPLLDTLLPDTLLLNGGVFRAAALARRLGDTLAAWRGAPLRMLDNDDTEVAVARGAVAYALAGQGRAPAIAGGAARSYFLVLDDPAAGAPASVEAKAEAKAGARIGRAICVLARGSEIGTEIMLQERTFGLRVGQPVRFHLMSSSAGGNAQVGDIIDLDDASLVRLPPIAMVLPADPGVEGAAGGAGMSATARDARRQIRVHLASTLTELGTLQMHCVEAVARDGAGGAGSAGGAASAAAAPSAPSAASPCARRWLLQFQLRAHVPEIASDSACGAAVGDDDPSARTAIPGLSDALDKIDRIFGLRTQQVDAKDVRQLRLHLEQLLGSRERWSTPLLRQLFDALMARAGKRRRSSEHERAWFNLAGYCLRPGYGAPLDEWRIEQLWVLFEAGVQHGNDSAVCAQWWTLWRRVTGGLDGPAQLRLLADFACNVQGGGDASATLVNASFDDMLSLCGALERIPSAYKVEIGTWLLGQLPGAHDSVDKLADKQVDKQVVKQGAKHAGKQERKHGVKAQADDQSKLDARTARLLWALGRIGARQPFHGNADDVVPPAVAAEWITTLLALDWKRIDAAAFACAHIARMSGDRARDVDPQLRERLVSRLKASSAPPGWALMVEEVVQLGFDDERRMLGEALPPGLILLS